jgi:hypothetical protein
MKKPSAFAAERLSQAAGAACKDVEARKTRMAAPVSFTCWLAANRYTS